MNYKNLVIENYRRMKKKLNIFSKMPNNPKNNCIFALTSFFTDKLCKVKTHKELQASVWLKVPRCFLHFCIKDLSATRLFLFILTIYIMTSQIGSGQSYATLKTEQVSAASAVSVSNPCPISPEGIKFLQYLREMRQYYENHPYHKEYGEGCLAYDTLNNLNDAIEQTVIDVGELIAIELKNNLYYYDTNLKTERRVV